MQRKSSSARPLRIIIVGAGIAGLTAANFLRRAGHAVLVLEQRSGEYEAGAAIMLPPTTNALFSRFGFDPEHYGANEYLYMTEYDADGSLVARRALASPGMRKASVEGVESSEMKGGVKGRRTHHVQHAENDKFLIMHRANLHAALRESATRGYLPGMPVQIRQSARVVDIDAAAGRVTLENGEHLEADVVIGADGVSSVCRKHISRGGADDVKLFDTGKSAYQFLILRAKAQLNEYTFNFAETEGEFIGWWGSDRRITMYPCSNNELLNFVCILPSSEAEEKPEAEKMDWTSKGNKHKMLEAYKEWNNQELLELLSLAEPNTIRTWQIQDMNKLPSFVNGKLVLIGDAARPIQPYYCQYGAQAIEDAASLAIMLSAGTASNTVPERLKLYEECRYERGHYMQDFVRRTGSDRGASERPAPAEIEGFMQAVMSHKEWEHSTRRLQQWLKSQPTSS